MIKSSCKRLPLLLLPIALLLPAMSQAQTTHTWLGNWNDQWNASNNWNTNTLPANGDNLIFDGNNTLTFNDLTNLLLRHITFAQTAGGAFEIDGNAFRIGGTITNNSDDEVTIWNNIQIVGGGGAIPHSYPNQTAEGLILDVGQGGMTLHGAITMDNNERNFFKYGEGTLTITGSAEVSRWLIGAGTLHVDGGTITDAGGTARTGIGSGWDPNAPETFASATLLFTNNAQATFLGTRITPYSGTNRVIIESGSVVTLQVGENNSSDFPPNPDDGSGRAVGLSILHYDITQQGSGGLYTGAAGVWSPSVSHAIVTGNTANGIKTGFGYRADANAKVEVATPHITAYTGGALSDANGQRRLTGGTVNAGGNRTVGALTLTGAAGGLLRTNASNGYGELSIIAFLMEQGTGNYTIDMRWTPVSASHSTRYIHQYSTDGTLTFNYGLTRGGANNTPHLVKTGPGTVIFVEGGATQALNHIGQTEIQGGRFVLNSVMGSTNYLRVRGEDSVLSGKGSIGGADVSGSPRYTAVQIFDGGTLEGDRHTEKALDITGSLLFLEDGNYQMALHANPQYDPLTVQGTTTGSNPTAALVTLAGNLELALEYAPVQNEWIVLLRTNGGINGTFDTINGNAFISGNLLQLTHNANDYWFQIDYAYTGDVGFTSVALYAIPEPSTVALLAGVALSGLVYLRRRRR